MRSRLSSRDVETRALADEWQGWFAWRPVPCGGSRWVWLEWVERRLVNLSGAGQPLRLWSYRRLVSPAGK